jgi:CBS domain containing-hemolysin-like protein
MVERRAGVDSARRAPLLDPRGMTASELAMSDLAGGSAPVVEPWLGLVLAVVLVALNGFFVAAEFAIVKVRPTQIEPHARNGTVRGRVAQHLVHHLDAYLSATQLGITLASLALGWIGEPAFAWIVRPVVGLVPGATENLLHSASLTVAFLTITVLHIVLGELAPKSLAIRKAELTTLWVAIPLYSFYKVTFPIIWVLNHTANGLLKLVGIEPVGEAQLTHSEDELRLLLSSEYAGKLSSQKRELLDNVFELSHRVARQIMVPRADVTYLALSHGFEENLKTARESEYTRFPLCTEHLDEVIGLVHIKDVFRAEPAPKTLEEVKREITFVPETMPLDALLRRMRQERLHMAAVVDEYGGISGIVTMEDVIEEIVGQIQDEFDEEIPDVMPVGDGVYRVSGTTLVMDLEEALELELSDRDEDTVAGLVLSELGRSPRVGDKVVVGTAEFEVLEAFRRRIRLLEVRVHQDDKKDSTPPGG